MEQLKTYFNGLSPEEREAFAERCNTTAKHIKNVMYEVRPCAPGLAVLIEKHSDGAVPRPTLRKDWQEIWPELIAHAGGQQAQAALYRRAQQQSEPSSAAVADPQGAAHG